jgi:hypothetical protein
MFKICPMFLMERKDIHLVAVVVVAATVVIPPQPPPPMVTELVEADRDELLQDKFRNLCEE